MFVQSLLLAGAFGGEPSLADEDPAPSPRPFATVETMRQLLVQKIGERSNEIGGAAGAFAAVSGPEWVGSAGSTGEGHPGVSAGANDPQGVTNRFFEGVYASGATGIRSDAVYVPGLAAVFTLEVPVKVVARPAPATADAPAARTREGDDAEWDAVAGGGTSDATRSYLRAWVATRVASNAVASTSHEFSEESIDALHETVVDPLARFARKLELESGERVAVVVTLTPAQARFASLGGGLFSSYPTGSASIGTDPAGDAGVGYSDSDGDGFADVAFANVPPPDTRHVFEIASEDLAAHAAGRIDVKRLAECVRVKRY
jgi:hypothetical protein